MKKMFLTFDTEDFINPNAINSLDIILDLLNKYKLKAIFFITGHMAEKISNFPHIVDKITNHKIGFHSSSHSVRPIIPEYTDVKKYEKAYDLTLERETSHINPLTGKIERSGGLFFLRDLFYPKKIETFRAPGGNWTPPNLEALVELGIKFDFSTNITHSEPVFFKTITFFPDTYTQKWEGSITDYTCFLSAFFRRKILVFDLHPTLLVNKTEWDKIYFNGNPNILYKTPERQMNEIEYLFNKLELFFKVITFLRQNKLIDMEPKLITAKKKLEPNQNGIEKWYQMSMRWSKNFFNYHPKFIHEHFIEFFK